MNRLKKFISMPQPVRKSFFSSLRYYNYALCELDSGNKSVPFYIGKGKGERCLQHLRNTVNCHKDQRVSDLMEKGRLGIDILAYGLDEKTAYAIESVCIDLLSIDNLDNKIRGSGVEFKRLPIHELASVLSKETIQVLPEHRGIAFLLEKTFKSHFGDLELLEHTRGIWRRRQSDDVRYAYATYRGIVKEVYEIHSWVPAGAQEYFTRTLNPKACENRFEFVGRKAPSELRERYVGNLIDKKRSYGDPFVKVGFDWA